MIEIHPAKIEYRENSIIISSNVRYGGNDHLLWYKYSSEFSDYIVTENLDAFVVGLIFLGLKRNEDILVKGQISEKLLYSLNNYLIPALVLSNPEFESIRIIADEINSENLNKGKISGTGLSLGIDSLATYYDHQNENGSYKIDYFTFFNGGSHGDMGGGNAHKVYLDRLKKVKEFAFEAGKKVIAVDSNLSEILQMNFQQTHSLRNISFVLHLQKLFKNYFYASAYRFDHFSLNGKDTSDADFFYLRLLDTESTNFYSSVAQLSRVERTLLISKHKETFGYLDVCLDLYKNNNWVNCSKCHKCMRTQLTLDLAGKLNLYHQVFDIETYNKNRSRYIGELFLKKYDSALDQEVRAYLKNQNLKIGGQEYLAGINSFLNDQKNKLKKKIKKIL